MSRSARRSPHQASNRSAQAKSRPSQAAGRSSGSFRFLWITDPWDTLDHPKDTTLRLAEEALALGAEAWWCDGRTLRWEHDSVVLDARQFLQIYPGRAEKAFRLSEPVAMRPTEFDSLHYRTDPPVDLAYLHPLQLLVMGLEVRGAGQSPRARKSSRSHARRAELVNPAWPLLAGNEKLEGGALGDLAPATVASSQWDALSAFGQVQGRTVLKPLHQAQSKGIELLDWRSSDGVQHARKALEAVTEGFTRPALLQAYLPGISEGEKRLWFADGQLVGVVRKLPLAGDFRVDMDRGSRLALAELDSSERKSAQRIGKHLLARGIRLAAVDLIEGKITDFNFTSPGLIPQMEGVTGQNLARPIIQALMRKPPVSRR